MEALSLINISSFPMSTFKYSLVFCILRLREEKSFFKSHVSKMSDILFFMFSSKKCWVEVSKLEDPLYLKLESRVL
jgi:hypothetical protein